MTAAVRVVFYRSGFLGNVGGQRRKGSGEGGTTARKTGLSLSPDRGWGEREVKLALCSGSTQPRPHPSHFPCPELPGGRGRVILASVQPHVTPVTASSHAARRHRCTGAFQGARHQNVGQRLRRAGYGASQGRPKGTGQSLFPSTESL